MEIVAEAFEARVLVVVGGSFPRRALRSALTWAGFRTDAESNGMDAVERAYGGGYDSVVCDLDLPGMSGLAVALSLGCMARPPRAILIAERLSPALVQAAERAGAAEVVARPLRIPELVDKLRDLTRDRKTAGRRGLNVVARVAPSRGHDCSGEEVVLRVEAGTLARVLCSDRCDREPSQGCDGVPDFRAGEIVWIPREWGGEQGVGLQVRELRAVPPRPPESL